MKDNINHVTVEWTMPCRCPYCESEKVIKAPDLSKEIDVGSRAGAKDTTAISIYRCLSCSRIFDQRELDGVIQFS